MSTTHPRRKKHFFGVHSRTCGVEGEAPRALPVEGATRAPQNRCRLNKFLAQTTNLSRRAADHAIATGTVRVNGTVVTQLGTTVNPQRDRVEYQGMRLHTAHEKIYLAFYKPKNCLVTKSDPRGRRTIWEWLMPYRDACNAIGRLDFASEGLLLITNDGVLIQRLTHPSHEVPKIYYVKVRGIPNERVLAAVAKGVRLDDTQLQPMPARIVSRTDHNAWLEMRLHEGKFRQIRRVYEQLGHPVSKLRRVAVGPITVGGLTPGKHRRLRPREIARLK